VDARLAFRAKHLFDRAERQRAFEALSPRLQKLLNELGRQRCPRCGGFSRDGDLCERCEEREAFYNEVNGDSLDPEGLRS